MEGTGGQSMTIAGVYCIAMGILIIVMRVIKFAKKKPMSTHNGSAGKRGKIAMGSHLSAEIVTAGLLIVSGAALLNQDAWSINAFLIATGMLIYAIINSTGYFAQLRQWPMVILFGVLLVLALGSLAAVIIDINTLIY
jgi:hypothetical protein